MLDDEERLMANDAYAILGLATTATEDEIRSAWRRAARETHPDLHRTDPYAQKRFIEAKNAYDTLSDPGRRAQYDHERHLRTQYGDRVEPTRVKEKERAPAWWDDVFRAPAHPETLYRRAPRTSYVNPYWEDEQRDLEASLGTRFAWNRQGVYTGTTERRRNPFRSKWRNGGKIG